jgi:nucleoside-diphosphate-sugar epimerase
MTVLLLGATGFIGPAVIRALDAAGADVVAASRAGTGPYGVALDRRDVRKVLDVVRNRRVTSVIDLLAFTEADTLPLVAALAGAVERWVMASSGDVYQHYEGLHRRAEPPRAQTPLLETSPLRTTRYPYRMTPRRAATCSDAWMDDYDKIPLETGVRSSFETAGVILRLPMIYGPYDRLRRFGWLIAPMLAAKRRISIDPAWAAWRTTYGYVDDVASALACAALHPRAAGLTFNIGELGGPDHYGWVARFSRVMGWDGELDPAPAPPETPLSKLDLSYSMETCSAAFRETLGWAEPTALEDALLCTVADEQRRG